MMRSRVWRTIRWSAAAVGALAVAAVVWTFLPLPKDLLSRDGGSGVTIEDRHGIALRSTRARDGSAARWVPFDEIDSDIIAAFVATEDKRFWDHGGVDIRALGRALRDDIRARRVVSGASTITMQLARLVVSHRRTWTGKLGQAMWALRLERHLSKPEIIEQYLNRVELGQGTAGVGGASALYFRASASSLSIGQAAMLAGLAHAPSRDNPHVSQTRARARRAVALARMRRLGLATREEVARARTEPLSRTGGPPPFIAPHFTTRVLSWAAADSALRNATRIRTSIDVELQRHVEEEVRHTVDVLADRGVADAAAVVLDNASGEVLAWVGSPDFWGPNDGQTDMVVSARQPGSALKPFLYGLSFDRGITAATVLADVPMSYATSTGPYAPRNYDRRFRGPTRAREALASSYNVPAVEVAERVGAGAFLRTLRLAGFESLEKDAEHYGLGLALGNGDVTLIEMANAYRALANDGEWRPWTWRKTERSGDHRRVISAAASAIVLDILSDPVARVPGFGIATPFDFPFPVAVKTGTSRHFTDNWAIGTTKGFTVAVWAGNFNGRPMEGVSGITGAGPLLHRIVMATAGRVPAGRLTRPADVGARPVEVCRLSGLIATGSCASMTEWFIAGTEPTRVDDWERGGRVSIPSQFATADVEEAAAARSASMFHPVEVDVSMDRPKAPQRPLGFRILSPLDGDRYAIPPGIEAKYATIPLRAAEGGDSVRWRIDGKEFEGGRWLLEAGSHVIDAISARGDSARVRIQVQR